LYIYYKTVYNQHHRHFLSILLSSHASAKCDFMYMNYDKMMETNDGTQILQTHAMHDTDTYPWDNFDRCLCKWLRTIAAIIIDKLLVEFIYITQNADTRQIIILKCGACVWWSCNNSKEFHEFDVIIKRNK
jgi:hypothetical protein